MIISVSFPVGWDWIFPSGVKSLAFSLDAGLGIDRFEA